MLNSVNKIFTLNYDTFSEKICNRSDIIHLHGRLDYYYDYYNNLKLTPINLEILRKKFWEATKEIYIACDTPYKIIEMNSLDFERNFDFMLKMLGSSTKNLENTLKDR